MCLFDDLLYLTLQVPDGLYEALEDHMKSFGIPNKHEDATSRRTRLSYTTIGVFLLLYGSLEEKLIARSVVLCLWTCEFKYI